jgi:hypothetical protein
MSAAQTISDPSAPQVSALISSTSRSCIKHPFAVQPFGSADASEKKRTQTAMNSEKLSIP